MSINVLASTIVIASTSYVQPVADVSYTQPVAQVSYVEPVVQVNYTQIQVTAELTTPGRIEVDVITPADEISLSAGKTFTDHTNGINDLFLKVFNKGPQDQVSFTDTITDRVIGKVLADLAALVEETNITFGKALADSTSFVDIAALDTTKELADLLGIPVDIAAKHFTKALEDSVTLADAPALLAQLAQTDALSTADTATVEANFNPANDTANVTDTTVFEQNKGLSDDITLLDGISIVVQRQIVKLFSDLVAATDAQILDITTQKADNITASSSGYLLMQDYCDMTYFLEDYVGLSRTFT